MHKDEQARAHKLGSSSLRGERLARGERSDASRARQTSRKVTSQRESTAFPVSLLAFLVKTRPSENAIFDRSEGTVRIRMLAERGRRAALAKARGLRTLSDAPGTLGEYTAPGLHFYGENITQA
jgi:hypothetical protein